jgi:pyrimidine operon attenuation protein / uracil phosphoribosyltransferase
MAKRERPLLAGEHLLTASAQVLTPDEVRRAVNRIAHEIVERNHGAADVVVVGLQTGGTWMAYALAEALGRIESTQVPVGLLDATFERDDYGMRPMTEAAPTVIDFDLTGRTVVLCDDVLFTGRTVRAALNALVRYGRARSVQLAVMVDRGHRELPIRPDFVGKNLPTRRDELVDATSDGVWITRLEAARPDSALLDSAHPDSAQSHSDGGAP